MVPTTLVKSVRQQSESVPPCMDKPVNNTVQASRLKIQNSKVLKIQKKQKLNIGKNDLTLFFSFLDFIVQSGQSEREDFSSKSRR